MTGTPVTDDRQAIVEYLGGQLVGPLDGPEEVLGEYPHKRYLTAILFPREAETAVELDDDIADEGAGEAGEESSEDPIALAAQQLPSSLGLSFVLPGWESFQVEVSAGAYTREDDGWHRASVDLAGDAAILVTPPAQPGRAPSLPILEGRASVDVMWRSLGNGALVTVALVNQRRIPVDGRMDPQDCLLQVRMRCLPQMGVLAYPAGMRIQTGEEEEEQALLYRDVPTYAVGHGCGLGVSTFGRAAQ